MMRNTGSIDPEECPVTEEFLATLLQLTLAEVTEHSNHLPKEKRAQLAVYCYRRSHLRQQGLAIAKQCSQRSLVEEAGHAGEMIHFQAQNMDKMLTGDGYSPPRFSKPRLRLHKV